MEKIVSKINLKTETREFAADELTESELDNVSGGEVEGALAALKTMMKDSGLLSAANEYLFCSWLPGYC
jgi:bacteriocin-like protein